MSFDACVSVWCDIYVSLLCVQTWIQRRTNVTSAVNAHVVCLPLLWTLEFLRHVCVFVMYSVCVFFCIFVQYFLVHPVLQLQGFPVTEMQFSHVHHRFSRSQTSGQKVGPLSPVVRGPLHNHPKRFRLRWAVTIWATRAEIVLFHVGVLCFVFFFVCSNPEPNISNADGINGW